MSRIIVRSETFQTTLVYLIILNWINLPRRHVEIKNRANYLIQKCQKTDLELTQHPWERRETQ